MTAEQIKVVITIVAYVAAVLAVFVVAGVWFEWQLKKYQIERKAKRACINSKLRIAEERRTA